MSAAAHSRSDDRSYRLVGSDFVGALLEAPTAPGVAFASRFAAREPLLRKKGRGGLGSQLGGLVFDLGDHGAQAVATGGTQVAEQIDTVEEAVHVVVMNALGGLLIER